MTLPTTGPISLGMINTELGKAIGQAISLNDPAVRALAGKPSGTISLSDLRGKASGSTLVAGQNLVGGMILMIGFTAQIGSLVNPVPGAPSKILSFSTQDGRGVVLFEGNVIAALAGKAVYIDGRRVPMNTPTLNVNTNWQTTATYNDFGFVNGGTYKVFVG